MGTYNDAFQGILNQYEAALQELDSRSRPGEGLFGFGRKKADDPCHDAMDQSVETLVSRLAADPDAVSEVPGFLRLLLEAESARPWPDHARWMLVAAQRHGMPLVPLLSPSDASDLASWYAARYSRFDRFPAQQTLLKALKARAALR